MTTVIVHTGSVTVPGMCVACAAPTTVPASGPQRKRRMLEASGSIRVGNTITTDKISFPLCEACADTRDRERVRSTNYPGRGWTIGVGLLAALLCVGWIVAVNRLPDSALAAVAFWAFVVAVVAAVTLSKQLRKRNDRLNPPSEADRVRLDALAKAASVQPVSGGTSLAGITFGNERFAEAFSALNTGVSAGMFFGQSPGGPSSLVHP
jgi:hypothetical protein